MSSNNDSHNEHTGSHMVAISTSPLLRLSRELHDEIYAYALYKPNGVYIYREEVGKANFSTSPHKNRNINPLQSTCHQLRAETLGLERQFNELIFHAEQHQNREFMGKTPAVQFLGFLDMCSEAWRQRVRRVALLPYSVEACENSPLLIADVHLVMFLCERYPS
jgi:hypothetical protein